VLFPTDDLIRGGHSAGLEDYLASPALSREDKMALLRRRYRYRMFLSGARDVLESRPVVASLRDTTNAADEAIAAAWAMAGRPARMAILALGRLASVEFDCLSDADLLFVRDKRMNHDTAARVAEDVVQALSAYTNDGTVMPVDLRLRPHGGEGEIVLVAEKLEAYFQAHALPWEALTYTKLRKVAGSDSVTTQTLKAAAGLHDRFATEESFTREVREMRTKLEKADGLKTGIGGMYDIDFLIGYIVIRHGIHTVEGSIGERLQMLNRAGLVGNPELQVLLDALELFRTVEHAIRLVTGRAGKDLPVSPVAQANVAELTSRMMTRELGESMEDELLSARVKVREVFEKVVR